MPLLLNRTNHRHLNYRFEEAVHQALQIELNLVSLHLLLRDDNKIS